MPVRNKDSLWQCCTKFVKSVEHSDFLTTFRRIQLASYDRKHRAVSSARYRN